MGRKKSEPKEKLEKEKKEPKTSLFDIISYLTNKKKPWKELTIDEQKTFNPYMINRFLSMDLYLCDAINQLQKYTINSMDKKDVYTLYFYLLPKQSFYLKYIKSKNEIPEKDLEILVKYYKLSRRECEDYYLILNKDSEGKQRLEQIKENFAYENNKK
jgi:hypothetical protein